MKVYKIQAAVLRKNGGPLKIETLRNLVKAPKDLFSLRADGNLTGFFQGGDPHETAIAFPREAVVYLAGTLTDEVSYFFELEQKNRSIKGT